MSPVGAGSSQAESGSTSTGSVVAGTGDDRSIGRARRLRPRRLSRQTLVAIRYSHVRNDDLPSKESSPCQALTSVSWTASSASNSDPSMR